MISDQMAPAYTGRSCVQECLHKHGVFKPHVACVYVVLHFTSRNMCEAQCQKVRPLLGQRWRVASSKAQSRLQIGRCLRLRVGFQPRKCRLMPLASLVELASDWTSLDVVGHLCGLRSGDPGRARCRFSCSLIHSTARTQVGPRASAHMSRDARAEQTPQWRAGVRRHGSQRRSHDHGCDRAWDSCAETRIAGSDGVDSRLLQSRSPPCGGCFHSRRWHKRRGHALVFARGTWGTPSSHLVASACRFAARGSQRLDRGGSN